MTEKGTDLIIEGETILPAIADQTLIAVADQAEQRIEAMNKIKRLALKLTNPHDWVNENGRPYLQASGGEKVARLFGISWRIFEPTRESLEGGHFTYTYHGEFSLAGATIEAIGTRSSKDGFFKRYDKERVELPPSEIDPGDVKKSAYTNLLGNGITRLLGIRNLTWEDLKEFAGIEQKDVGSVDYKKQSKASSSPGQSSQGGKPTISDPNAPATEAQIKAINSLLSERFKITEQIEKHEKVSKIIGIDGIIPTFDQLTKAQASQVIKTLQDEANAQQGDEQ